MLGIAFILGTVIHRHAVEGAATERVMEDVLHNAPDLRAVDGSKVRASLEYWQERIQTETIVDVVIRDLGIAMVVAVLLSLLIESYARNRLQDEIRSGVIEAAFKRLIPASAFDQVSAHIMQAKLTKESSVIEMVIRSDPAVSAGNAGFYVSNTILRYQLRSLTGRPVKDTICARLDRDVTFQAQDGRRLPRFESVTIGDKKLLGGELKSLLSDDECTFSTPATIDGSPLSVVVVLEEILRVPDTFVWNTQLCTDHTSISIDASGISGVGFEVTALHPEASRLVEHVPGRNWEFKVGMLPWQGFQVRSWQKADPKVLPSVAPSAELDKKTTEA